MPTKWLQERTNGSKNGIGMAFEGLAWIPAPRETGESTQARVPRRQSCAPPQRVPTKVVSAHKVVITHSVVSTHHPLAPCTHPVCPRAWPQKALRGGIQSPVLQPFPRSWSHFVANCCQKLTNLVNIVFEIPPRRALRGAVRGCSVLLLLFFIPVHRRVG